MTKAVSITVEQFNELRKLSIEVVDLIKASSTATLGRAGDLVNMLIDIENRYLDGERPLGPTENIGSCEPDPVIVRWDKTGSVWHTDVDKVGRYSVRRPGLRQPYEAYLNGKSLNLMPDSDPGVLKRSIERRIKEARRINAMHE